MTIRDCPSCGAPIVGSAFCSECGQSLREPIAEGTVDAEASGGKTPRRWVRIAVFAFGFLLFAGGATALVMNRQSVARAADHRAMDACESANGTGRCSRKHTGDWERSAADVRAEAECQGHYRVCAAVDTGGWKQVSTANFIKGTFVLHTTTSLQPGGGCSGAGGYSDISPEAQVTVRNESGTILANTSLGAGTTQPSGRDCQFSFVVYSVPLAQAYQIEVSHRSNINYTRSQMEANGWTVGLSLGT